MASAEHKDLAAFIKSIHSNLRKESQIYGPKEAWERHLADSEKLQKYAESMEKLATKHWAENVADPNKNTKCRIEWVKLQCLEYFFNGGIKFYWDREMNIRRKMTIDQNIKRISLCQENSNHGAPNAVKNVTSIKIIQNKHDTKNLIESSDKTSSTASVKKSFETSVQNDSLESSSKTDPSPAQSLDTKTLKIKLLDVGSCYNPFGSIEFFDIMAIDLAPSCKEVLQCDFLSVEIKEENLYSNNGKQILQLTMNSFDTVVFCLLLEYLPCPDQRYTCCEKAYNLLKPEGLLLIITPDSKHVGANAKFMKSWLYVLSNLGFMRIKYEKLPHTHCLAFRKCIYKEVAVRAASLQKFSKDDELFYSTNKIFIPQDFNIDTRKNIVVESTKNDESEGLNFFIELPYT